MIKAPIAVLPDATLVDLKTWQGGVDAAGDYPARVTAAAAEFKRCRQLAAFRPVLEALTEMCSGTQRVCLSS